MSEKNDILLSLLKFGKKNLDSPFKWENLENQLKKEDFKTDLPPIKTILDTYKGEIFHTKKINGVELSYLASESYFHLLEYEELMESRKASESARCYSSWAIGISVVALVVSIVFGVIQVNSPITIDPSLIESIQESINPIKK